MLHFIPTGIFPNDGLHNYGEHGTTSYTLRDVESLSSTVYSEAEGCEMIACVCCSGDQISNIEVG